MKKDGRTEMGGGGGEDRTIEAEMREGGRFTRKHDEHKRVKQTKGNQFYQKISYVFFLYFPFYRIQEDVTVKRHVAEGIRLLVDRFFLLSASREVSYVE